MIWRSNLDGCESTVYRLEGVVAGICNAAVATIHLWRY